MAAITPLPRIRYTAKDYQSSLDELLLTRRQHLPEWTDESDDDFGIQQLKLFLLSTDVLSLYQDRYANEAFMPTCQKRKSMIAHLTRIGYQMALAESAEGYVQMTIDATAGAVTRPAGTRIQSKDDPTLTVETTESVVAAAGGVRIVTAHAQEGTTYPNLTDFEIIGLANGSGEQAYQLPRAGITKNGLTIAVDTTGTGVAWETWTYVTTLTGQGPLDKVYTYEVDENDVVTILFGDGQEGLAPIANAAIGARYHVGGGLRGNVPPNVLRIFVSPQAEDLAVVNQDWFVGGAEKEDIEHARRAGPATVRANDRLVTIEDYVNVLGNLAGVIEVYAQDAYPRRVYVYVLPSGGIGSTIPTIVTDTVATKKMAGVSVRIAGAIGLSLSIRANVYCYDNYRQSVVKTQSETHTRKLFDLTIAYDQRFVHMGFDLPKSKVEEALEKYDGVKRVDITEFCLISDPPGTILQNIHVEPYQIATIESNMPVLTMYGGIVS